jgi:hypothetical protein
MRADSSKTLANSCLVKERLEKHSETMPINHKGMAEEEDAHLEKDIQKLLCPNPFFNSLTPGVEMRRSKVKSKSTRVIFKP